MSDKNLLHKLHAEKGAQKRWGKHDKRRASAINAINARWAKKHRDNEDDVALPPPDAGDDTSTAAPVPEIVEEPPATPALEFNFCPPPPLPAFYAAEEGGTTGGRANGI
uniref:Uncharacterized protein n=1 Tax=Globodera rostochiensis TaxID=31243 RepID=A0A914H6E6_GLORO